MLLLRPFTAGNAWPCSPEWTTISSSDLPELEGFLKQHCGNTDQIRDQPLLYVEAALILRHIAPFMAQRQHPPMFRPQTKGLLQTLKHQIAVLRPITMPTKCRQGQCVRRVVGQIKPAFKRQYRCPRIDKPGTARLYQAIELGLADCLLLQLTDLFQIFEILEGLRPIRPGKFLVAPSRA